MFVLQLPSLSRVRQMVESMIETRCALQECLNHIRLLCCPEDPLFRALSDAIEAINNSKLIPPNVVGSQGPEAPAPDPAAGAMS